MSEPKGLGSKILGLFVETEDKPPQVAPSTQAPAVPASSPINTLQYDQEMLDTLQKVISARKTPYTALLENAERLRSVISDDVTRLKAAFTMISAEGQRTIDTVVSAIDVHIADINSEQTRFKASSDTAMKEKVGSLSASAQNAISSRDADLNQIEALQQQITRLQQSAASSDAKATELNRQASEAEAEIVQISAKFNSAAEFIKQDLSTKKQSLATVLTT